MNTRSTYLSSLGHKHGPQESGSIWCTLKQSVTIWALASWPSSEAATWPPRLPGKLRPWRLRLGRLRPGRLRPGELRLGRFRPGRFRLGKPKIPQDAFKMAQGSSKGGQDASKVPKRPPKSTKIDVSSQLRILQGFRPHTLRVH